MKTDMQSNHPTAVTVSTPDGPIEILVRSSARARRTQLKVARKERRVALVVPVNGKYADALRYAQSQRGASWVAKATQWINARLGNTTSKPKISLTEGAIVPILGVPHTVRISSSVTRVTHRDGEILVPGSAEQTAWRVRKYLMELAHAELSVHAHRFAKTLDRDIGKIAVRDTVSRWGSCARKSGNLSFCWRLILAPAHILIYVAAHEVAHRVEANHSARFWRVVDQLGVDAKASRAWLRANSARLHSYN